MKKLSLVCSFSVFSIALMGCGGGHYSSSISSSSAGSASVSSSTWVSSSSANGAEFEVLSSSFEENGSLPGDFSCEGKAFGQGGFSPELSWSGAPEATKSYAIVFKDLTVISGPQAALGYHWAVWNIPDAITLLPRGLSTTQFPSEMGGAEQMNGINNGFEYFGPCPSYDFCNTGQRNTDNYSFTVYALADATISPGASVQEIDDYLDSVALNKAEIQVVSDAAPSCE